MGIIMVVFLTALVIWGLFTEGGEQIVSRLTRGWVKPAAVAWLGLVALFALSYRLIPAPLAWVRDVIAGLMLIGVAYALSHWSLRSATAKGFIQNKFFNGNDIWNEPNFKLYVGALWGMGLILAVPLPWWDVVLNIGAFAAAIVWFLYKAYQGGEKLKMAGAREESV